MLDRLLKAELKERLSLYIFGNGSQTVSHRVSLFNVLLTSALGTTFIGRTARLLLIGLVSIIFVYSLQYFFKREAFDQSTLPFLQQVLSMRPFAIYVLISFVGVDAISFFQTASFARLAAYCKNPIEVAFLAFADVVVSLFLVIVFLPVFIYASHRIAASPHDAYIRLVLVESIQSQKLGLRELILMPAPRVTAPDSFNSEMKKEDDLLADAGWIYSSPRLYVGAKDENVTIARAINGEISEAGDSLIFVKGDIKTEEVARMIAIVLKTSKGVNEVKAVDTSSDLFGNAAYAFEVSGTSRSMPLTFLSSYSFIMGDINFFGAGIYEALSLGSKTFEENGITYNSFLSNVVDGMDGKIVYKCDDQVAKEIDREDFIKSTSECWEGVAISSSAISGMLSLLSYNLENNLDIPVLPTALSSVFLTILVYASILIWILLPYIRTLAERFTEKGAIALTNNIFTVSFCLAAIVIVPIVVIFT